MQEPAFHLNSKVVASLRDRQVNNDNNNYNDNNNDPRIKFEILLFFSSFLFRNLIELEGVGKLPHKRRCYSVL